VLVPFARVGHDVVVKLDKPLSEAEWDRLDDLLIEVGADDGMDIVEAHGLLTAVVSMPGMIMPSTWQPIVFGGEPSFESMDEAQEMMGLLMRLNNQISDELHAGAFVPLGYPDEEVIEGWCSGYIRGARLEDSWKDDEQGAAMIFPMAALSGVVDLVGEEDSEGNIITDPSKQLAACREGLPEYVQRTYDYFLARRRGLIPKAMAPKAAAKVGRNDPCPCGSGKKYKKCCLGS
jgi:uncharacterized protein